MAIAIAGRHLRLDVTEGTLFDGPILPHFHISGMAELSPKLDALNVLLRLSGGLDPAQAPVARDPRLPRLVEALRVRDALAEGASLREIGRVIQPGCDDWPGDGEHMKSRARRFVALARKLERLGPKGVLARTV